MNADEFKRRTGDLAHRCVKLSLALPESVLGKHIRLQLIRSSTSVAANYRAVCLAQSKAEFVSKLSITIEEADETCFWIEFAIEEALISQDNVQSLLNEAHELTAILLASRKTAKNRNSKFENHCTVLK